MYSPPVYQELARQHYAELLREAENSRLAHAANASPRRSLATRLRDFLSRRPAEQPALRPAAKPHY